MSDTGTDARTRLLARGEYSVVARSRAGFWRLTGLAACVILGAITYGMANGSLSGRTVTDVGPEVIRLAGVNQNLVREIEELRMRQAHDGAALAALQKDYAIQVEALRQANRNLAFYRKNVPGVVPND